MPMRMRLVNIFEIGTVKVSNFNNLALAVLDAVSRGHITRASNRVCSAVESLPTCKNKRNDM